MIKRLAAAVQLHLVPANGRNNSQAGQTTLNLDA